MTAHDEFLAIVRSNPWSLYSSVDGWQEAGQALTAELNGTLESMDMAVAEGATIKDAAKRAWTYMETVMDRPSNSNYGAGDSEGREHLAAAIQRHLKQRYGLTDARVDRWGGMSVSG